MSFSPTDAMFLAIALTILVIGLAGTMVLETLEDGQDKKDGEAKK